MLLWTKRIIGWLSFLALIGLLVSAGWVGYLADKRGGIEDVAWGRAPWRYELPQPDPAEISDYVRQNGLGPDLEPKLKAYVMTQVAPQASAVPDSRAPLKKYRNALGVLVLDPEGRVAASYPDYFKGERFTYPLGFELMASDQPLFYPGEYVNIYTRRHGDVTIDVRGVVIDIHGPEETEGETTDEGVSETEAQWKRRDWARDVRTRIRDYVPYSEAAMTQMLAGPDGKPAAILFTALNGDLQLKGAFWQSLWEEFGPGYRVAILMIASVSVYWILLGVWAGLDARWRGMSAWVWTPILLLTNFIGLLVYLLVRVPDPRGCPQCKKKVHNRYAVCPYCGFEMMSRCPACRAYIQPGWRFCPGCKLDLWSDEAKTKTRVRAAAVVQPVPRPLVEPAPAPPAPEQPRPQTATIGVTVVDDETGGALSGVRLTFSGPSHLTATTDSSGVGRAYGAEPGAYAISGEKDGYPKAELKLDLKPGETPELVMALKAETGALIGKAVDDETSGPIAGARVSIDSMRVDRDAETGPDGSFRFGDVPPGPYIVTAQKEGYLSARQSAQVRPAEETSLELRLRRDPARGEAGGSANQAEEGEGAGNV
jgi:hypothetical protein